MGKEFKLFEGRDFAPFYGMYNFNRKSSKIKKGDIALTDEETTFFRVEYTAITIAYHIIVDSAIALGAAVGIEKLLS